MDFLFKKLTSEYLDDFLAALDKPSFFHDADFSFGCYCTWFHWTDQLEAERSTADLQIRKSFKRNLAIDLIQKGRLNGFLAYYGNQVVGWCNAGLKQDYDRLRYDKTLWDEDTKDEKVMAIVCYVVHSDYQRRGIATNLLKQVCEDAEAQGYHMVEAYPHLQEDGRPSSLGSDSMYLKMGFQIIELPSGKIVARKKTLKKSVLSNAV